MTIRERRRLRMLWTIRRWLFLKGASLFVSLVIFLSQSTPVFAEEAKKITYAGLIKLLSKENKTVKESSPSAAKPVDATPNPKVKNKVRWSQVSEEDMKAEGTMVEMQGTVSAKNNYGMAVEKNVNESLGTAEEVWVVFHGKMKLSGIKSVGELEAGDKVKVKYKVTKAEKKILLSEITFVSKKPKEKPLVMVSEAAESAP